MIEGLSIELFIEILDIVEFFVSVGKQVVKKVFLLCGKIVVNLFFEVSICICIIFELVVKCFLVDVFNIDISIFVIFKGEFLMDMLWNFEVMDSDMFVVWYQVSGVFYFIVEFVCLNVVVINVGDGCYVYFI